MKLRALKNFWMTDKKRGTMVVRKKGDTFDVAHSDEGELVYTLLRDLCVTVIDSKFVPERGRYLCIHGGVSYTAEDGSPRVLIAGKEISLPQELASRFLVSGHVRPVDEKAWVPLRLLGPIVKENVVKRMFDTEPEHENWAKKGVAR